MRALAILPLVAASACIYNAPPPPDPFGDISFDWEFNGIPSCDDAGVDEVDLTMLRGGEVVLVLEREPCVGGGLTLRDINEGVYEIVIDAFSRESELLYSGSFAVRVIGGQDNYAGVVDLDPINPPPPPAEVGEVALFWAFQYPTDGTVVIDCALAGVEEVDVFVTPRGNFGQGFDDTFFCDDDGVIVRDLVEGPYDLRIQAYGSYHGDDILLYDSGDMVIDVIGDRQLDLGDVALPRLDESFSDFDVAWSFVGETCATNGVENVTLSFQRLDLDEPEDVFDISCDAASVLRRTFVPGSYAVSATALGNDGEDYFGTTTLDLPPNAVGQVDLVLAP
jgi:hypothetical protein